MDGFLLIDKESGMTSFDVIRALRKKLNFKKMGHSGTLDPLATGLVLVAIGEGTKLLEYLIGCIKEYEVRAHFGYVSDSYDADGKVVKCESEQKNVSPDFVSAVEKFKGVIDQVPPKFSALKIDGKRACDRVRDGEEIEMKSRKVTIYDYELLEENWPFVDFRIRCSAGTYIRSLIHDLGQDLGCGGYVKELRRTKISDFKVEEALKIDDVTVESIIPLEKIAKSFYQHHLDDSEYLVLSNGGFVEGSCAGKDPIIAFYKGKVVGVIEDYDYHSIKFRKRIITD